VSEGDPGKGSGSWLQALPKLELHIHLEGSISKARILAPRARLSDMTITYLVDGYYNPADELGVAWDDPAIGADWGVDDPILSGRDRANPRRADLDPALRPHAALRS